jgi:mRNA interferase MazF
MKPGKSKNYVPARGDIVWLEFNPQLGREQAGNRPALVVSPKEYNEKVGLAIFFPITNKEKGYPFECEINIKDKIRSKAWTGAREKQNILQRPARK